MIKHIKIAIPWWLKIGAKIVLARLPVPYALWKRAGLFEHGDMNRPQRALENFLQHAIAAGALEGEGAASHLRTNGEYAVLELGPGDALFTAVIARALGASKIWLVDQGSYVAMDMRPYAQLIGYLEQLGFSMDFAKGQQTMMELLKECAADYLTDGVHALARIPSESVDYCFSNAVLEHIPKGDFKLLAAELRRVMKPDGVSIHRVDLKDHLGGRLNNLRFSTATWEGDVFRRSGFYTNRIRFNEMIAVFEEAGFDCQLCRVTRWNALPTPRAKLNEAFQHLPDDDLFVSGFDVTLHRKG